MSAQRYINNDKDENEAVVNPVAEQFSFIRSNDKKRLVKRNTVTIERVAAEAGVSKTTVSFVLNGNTSISENTRQKVLKVIEVLGYQPNTNARNLSAKINQTICLVMPELGHVFEDQYFARALSGIYDEIEAEDYRLMLKKASYEFAALKDYLNLFYRKEIGGMLYLGSTLEDTYLRDFVNTGFPFVLVNSLIPNIDLPYVIADYRGAGLLATRYLLELGHKRIAHIQGSMSTYSARERLEGYQKALSEAGILIDRQLIAEGHFNREKTAECTKELMKLKNPPTAIFASNDVMAYGVLDALIELGISVPREVSIIGGDSLDASSMTVPPLTSVEQPIYEIARESVRLLIDLIEGNDGPTRRVWPSRLIERGSTMKVYSNRERRISRKIEELVLEEK